MPLHSDEGYWVDPTKWTVGITKQKLTELGVINAVSFEDNIIGKRVSMGQTVGTIESDSVLSDIVTPISGTVAEINEERVKAVNDEPEGNGWLFRLSPTGDTDGELKSLKQ